MAENALTVQAVRYYPEDPDASIEHLDLYDEIDVEGAVGSVNDGVLTLSLASSRLRDATSSPGYEIDLDPATARALAERILAALRGS